VSSGELSADWVLPVDGPPIAGGRVRYTDGEIVEVDVGRAERHYPNAAIVPGFVNAHSHLEYAVYAGFGDGLSFGPWIATHIERKRQLDSEHMLAIARRGVLDSLRSGITTTADYAYAGVAAAAAGELGLRAIVYLEVFAVDPRVAQQQFAAKLAEVTETELVRIGISPHAPYTCSLDVYRWCLSLGIPVGTHLAESRAENDWLERGEGGWSSLPSPPIAPTGKRSVATLAPVLGPELLCAHCVDLDPGEIALLADRDVPIAHCPRSNALLGCGTAPLAELREAGARIGLGTDSPASAPSFDVFEEMRTAVYLARAAARDPGALDAAAALRLATVDAAGVLQLDDRVGTLAAGKRADLTVVSLDGSPYHPVEDPAAAVVFGGSPERVLATVVDGKTRYTSEDEKTWQEVRSTASAARGRMLALRPR
jgi:5-methylthioadenosine/S-adenosylhomocysteine deaminase